MMAQMHFPAYLDIEKAQKVNMFTSWKQGQVYSA